MYLTNSTMTIIIAVSSFVLGVLGYKQIKSKETKEETKEETKIQTRLETQLNYISRGVDDIKLDMKMQDNKINGVIERVAKVEESSKSAHKRIDDIEGDR